MNSMLKIMFVTCAYALVATTSNGQLMVNPLVPPAGLIQKDQLWNVMVVNNYSTPQEVQLQVSMQDIGSGMKVLVGTSRLVTIFKGARQLKIADVSPITYNYTNSGAAVDRNSGGLLPIGRYTVCYTLVNAKAGEGGFPTAEECLPVEIQPMSPPQLNSPYNAALVDTKYPTFSWIPPAPLNMFNQLTYEFLLVEVAKGQNMNDAVQKNTPLYHQHRIKDIFLQYPSSSKPLEQGKSYAWQVIARGENESYIDKTESWNFSLKQDSVQNKVDYHSYVKLKQGITADYHEVTGKLKFEYNNETGDSLLQVNFYEAGISPIKPLYSKNIGVQPGQNFIVIEINQVRSFREKGIYDAELINSRNEHWNVKFKYSKSE